MRLLSLLMGWKENIHEPQLNWIHHLIIIFRPRSSQPKHLLKAQFNTPPTPKKRKLSSFAHPQVVLNLYNFLQYSTNEMLDRMTDFSPFTFRASFFKNESKWMSCSNVLLLYFHRKQENWDLNNTGVIKWWRDVHFCKRSTDKYAYNK